MDFRGTISNPSSVGNQMSVAVIPTRPLFHFNPLTFRIATRCGTSGTYTSSSSISISFISGYHEVIFGIVMP